MARLVRQGEHVILHTVFGGDADPPYSEFAKELHALSGSGDQPGGIRATEDAAVCRVLGCHQEVSRFPDAIYRRDGTGSWLYPNEQALFGSRAAGDGALVECIQKTITESCTSLRGQMYFPLGIGNHVDHAALHQTGVLFFKNDRTVLFYRDFYYEGDLPPAVETLRLRKVAAQVDQFDLDSKVTAFLQYRSQWPMLFGTAKAVARYFQAAARCSDSPTMLAEHLWMSDSRVELFV